MSEQETMEAAKTLAKPGKEHELLRKHAGEWNVIIKTWMNPGEPPMENKGTSRTRMILDGRVLAEEFKGDFEGTPFEGYGMLGYDNYRNRWWQTWNDNWSTGIFHAFGTPGPDTRTVTMTGKSDRAMQDRKDVETKSVYRFLNDNEHVFETYDVAPDGHDIKTMEIHYRRK
jgi:hypothetical protein